MIINFNTFKDFEIPLLRLCNANDSIICNINKPTEFNGDYNFGDFSVISFRVDYETDRECYEQISTRKEVYLGNYVENQQEDKPSEDCGYFIITDVEEVKNTTERYKLITAKSCEHELSNIAMPYIGEDDGYDTYGNRVLYHELEMGEGKTINGAPSIMKTIEPYIPGWTIKCDSNFIDPNADKDSLPTRAFETSDSDTIYGFLMNDVSESFGCVFLFDIYNRIIYIKSQKDAITPTDIYLSHDSLLEEISVKESEEDRVNCIQVTGSESVTISSVNPLGNDIIYNFTEEYDKKIMSEQLWSVMKLWMNSYKNSRDAYKSLMKQVYLYNTKISTLNSVKISLESKSSITNQMKIETEAMMTYNDEMSNQKNNEIYYHSRLLAVYGEQIDILEDLINDINTNLNTANNEISSIIQSLDFYNYIKTHYKDMSEDDIKRLYLELMRLIRTYSYTNSNIVLSESEKTIDNIVSIVAVEKFDSVDDTNRSDVDKKVNTYVQGFNSWIDTEISKWSTEKVIPKIDKQFEIINSLFEDSINILTKTSTPRCEINIDSSNFLFSEEFLHLSKQIKTGCSINIEKPDGTIIKHYVLKVSINYSDKTFSMTLSNRYRLNDALSIFEDSYGQTSSIASITKSHTVILEEQKKKIDAIDVARKQSLNYTKQKILSAENQEITVDDTGMTVKTIISTDENGEKVYDPYQFKLADGSILFTDDDWETAALAVGKYYDPRIGSWRMGINGQHIMANSIEASSLTVGSSYSTGTNLILDGSFDEDNENSPWVLNTEAGGGFVETITADVYTNSKLYEDKNLNVISVRPSSTVYVRDNNPIRITTTHKDTFALSCLLYGKILVKSTVREVGKEEPIYTDESSFENLETNNNKLLFKDVQLLSFLLESPTTIEITLEITNQYSYLGLSYVNNFSINGDGEQLSSLRFDTNESLDISTCGNFSVLPNQCWEPWVLKNEGLIKSDELTPLSSTSRGLTIDDSFKTCILINKIPFSLTNSNVDNYQLNISAIDTATKQNSLLLINTYLVDWRFIRMLTGDDISCEEFRNKFLASDKYVFSANNDFKIYKFISTYINCDNYVQNSKVNFHMDEDYDGDTPLYLISVLTGESGTSIRGLSIRDSNSESSQERHLDLFSRNWVDSEFENFDCTYYVKNDSGGFDNGKYIQLVAGFGIRQKNKMIAFEKLPYCVSSYVKGNGRIIVTWYDYDSLLQTDTIDFSSKFDDSWERIFSSLTSPERANYVQVTLSSYLESTVEDGDYNLLCAFDGVMLEQSTSLNAYQSNDKEIFAKYTFIDDNGISVYDGKIKIYNSNRDLVFHADEFGNLEMVGKVTSSSGKIGGWNINDNSFISENENAEINSEGYFQSKSNFSEEYTQNYITKMHGGSLKFIKDNDNKEVIASISLNLFGNTDSLTDSVDNLNIISKNKVAINRSFTDSGHSYVEPIITLGEKIRFHKHIEGDSFFDGQIVALNHIRSGGYDDRCIVVTRYELDRLIEDINNQIEQMANELTDAFMTELQKHLDEFEVETPKLEDITQQTGGNDEDPEEEPKKTITMDMWQALLPNMENELRDKGIFFPDNDGYGIYGRDYQHCCYDRAGRLGIKGNYKTGDGKSYEAYTEWNDRYSS